MGNISLIIVLLCELYAINSVVGSVGNDKSSLTFVIDTTGSMTDDIRQAKDASHAILDTAVRTESSQIDNFLLVTFNDPEVEKVIDTKVTEDFETALENITVYGGGDCPEMSMTGLEKALRLSRSGSFLYVFTDASAKDYHKAEIVRSLAQKKQSRIIFIVTGHCYSRETIDYQVYYQIAAISSGQVFRLEKKDVDKILAVVPHVITGKTSVLSSKYYKSGCKNIPFEVDNRINDITVSASGQNLNVTGVEYGKDKADTKFQTIVDTEDVKIVRIEAPIPGDYNIKICSAVAFTVVISAKTEFTFQHGFSVIAPKNINDTARQPIEKKMSYLSILLSDSRKSVVVKSVELIDMEEAVMVEFGVERVQDNFYVTNKFYSPNKMFKIAIKGYDTETNTTIKRISKTGIEPRKPYAEPIVEISEGSTMEVENNANVILTCKVLAFPEPNVTWVDSSGDVLTTDVKKKGPYEYISKLKLNGLVNHNEYTCKAENDQGSESNTISVKIRNSMEVLEEPKDDRVAYGADAHLTCRAKSTPSAYIAWMHNGEEIWSNEKYNISGHSLLTIKSLTEEQVGKYLCIIKNNFEEKVFSAIVAPPDLVAPKIDKKLKEMTIKAGTPLEISCQVAEGNSKPTVAWYFKGQNDKEYIHLSNETDNKIVNPNPERYSSYYRCEAKNIVDEDHYDVKVIVEFAPLIQNDTKTTIEAGVYDKVKVPCRVTGEPKPEVKWFKNDVQLTGEKYYVDRENLLSFTASREDGGDYVCVATNKHGQERISINVHLDKDRGSLNDFLYYYGSRHHS